MPSEQSDSRNGSETSSSSDEPQWMDTMIAMMSKVDDILATVGNTDTVSLPQIVAIGSQSSGKSSVLENIVGREFLPRSNGLCTRRPLKVELIRTGTHQTQNTTVTVCRKRRSSRRRNTRRMGGFSPQARRDFRRLGRS